MLLGNQTVADGVWAAVGGTGGNTSDYQGIQLPMQRIGLGRKRLVFLGIVLAKEGLGYFGNCVVWIHCSAICGA